MHTICGLLLLLCIIVFLIVILTIVLIAMNQRQLFRRISRSVIPCPFGKGTHFEVVQRILSPNAPCKPQILFALSLFGKPHSQNFHKRYYCPLLDFLRKIRASWPEAKVRIYMSQKIPDTMRQQFLHLGADLYIVAPDTKGYEGTLWRFFVADESEVPFVLSDADDDFFCDAYVATLKDWLRSDKPFFVQRYFWFTVLPMNACKWGAKPKAFKMKFGPEFSMQGLTEQYCDTAFGVDEGFLNREIWPKICNDVYISPWTPLEYAWIFIGWTFFVAIGFSVLLAIRPCESKHKH